MYVIPVHRVATIMLHEMALLRRPAGAPGVPPRLIRLHTPGVQAAEPPNMARRCPFRPKEDFACFDLPIYWNVVTSFPHCGYNNTMGVNFSKAIIMRWGCPKPINLFWNPGDHFCRLVHRNYVHVLLNGPKTEQGGPPQAAA